MKCTRVIQLSSTAGNITQINRNRPVADTCSMFWLQPYNRFIALRMAKSPTGSTSALPKQNIINMCALHSPIPLIDTAASAPWRRRENPNILWKGRWEQYLFTFLPFSVSVSFFVQPPPVAVAAPVLAPLHRRRPPPEMRRPWQHTADGLPS